jgi:hypothetical protein
MAVSAAQGVASHQAQAAQAAANARAAKEAAMSEYRQLNMQQRQEEAIAAQRKFAAQLQEAELLARGTVAAGEAGVAGRSVEDVLSNISRGALEEQNILTQNLEAYNRQLDEQRTGVRTRAQSRINQVAQPSLLSTGLKIASDASTVYMASGREFPNFFGSGDTNLVKRSLKASEGKGVLGIDDRVI